MTFHFSFKNDTVSASFRVPKTAKMSDMSIHISATQIAVGLRGEKPVIHGALYHDIEPDSASTTVSDGLFSLSFKSKLGWPSLLKAEESHAKPRRYVVVLQSPSSQRSLGLSVLPGDVLACIGDSKEKDGDDLKCETLFRLQCDVGLVPAKMVRAATADEHRSIEKYLRTARLDAPAVVNRDRSLFVHFEASTIYLFSKEISGITPAILASCPSEGFDELT
jgi:hypothetical protein